MKKISIILLSLCMLSITCCSKNKEAEVSEDQFPLRAVTSKLSIHSSLDQVEDFIKLNSSFNSYYDKDECYNITPDFIAENSDFEIFKYSKSTASFLLFENEIFPLGEFFGGFGITSMALSDFNQDNQYELYFTYSWGSGLHRSQVGYFDPSTKELTLFDYSYLNYDLILTKNDENSLCVNEATIAGESFVDFQISSNKVVANITLNNEEITLHVIEKEQ